MLSCETSTSSHQNIDYPTNVSCYEIAGEIGRGFFSRFYKGICKVRNDQEVALKVIELHNDSNEEKDKGMCANWEEIQYQVTILSRIQHSNIVPCFASFTIQNELWLILPFFENGSCTDIMKSIKLFKNGLKDEAMIATILNDVLNGMEYLHNNGYTHKDIQASNILLTKEGIAQLSDFGVSRVIQMQEMHRPSRNAFTASLWWTAPEMVEKGTNYPFTVDIWSLGITALELAYGKPPRAAYRPVKVLFLFYHYPCVKFWFGF